MDPVQTRDGCRIVPDRPRLGRGRQSLSQIRRYLGLGLLLHREDLERRDVAEMRARGFEQRLVYL